jgi:hypothetical protein
MGKRLTVFYSWQSDSPADLNRSFIEMALQEALKRLPADATLENALRDATVELDKDTQGVPGSPPVVDTILRKIEGCAAFVADLSFVGESKEGFTNASGKPRQFPNPNVLIEYGYAVRCHSHEKVVGIMNTAYGKPDPESVPFDLRHTVWPRTYELAESTAVDKKEQFEKLVESLVEAIGLILSKHFSTSVAIEKFIPKKPTKNPAIFFDDAANLIGDRSGASTATVPDGGKAYLRLYPSEVGPEINSEYEARELAIIGNLAPLGKVVSSCSFDRNVFGAISYEEKGGRLSILAQLFLSREIWGIDAKMLNADHLNEPRLFLGQEPVGAYIASGYLEDVFVKALGNYLGFAQKHLQLPPPLQVKAGLSGIKGYPIAVDAIYMRGNSLRDSVEWQGEIASYEKAAWEILGPFFDRIWANCGIQRTAQHQSELVKRFSAQWVHPIK